MQTYHIFGVANCIFDLKFFKTLYQITLIQHIKQINTQYTLIETLFNHKRKAEQVLGILETRNIIKCQTTTINVITIKN